MSFAADLGKFAVQTTKRVDRVRRGVALKLFGSIINDTPVDTGRLRGNWQTTLGAPASGDLPVRSAAAAMTEIRAVTSALKGDETIFFRNNLPYALAIEFGHSDQAPAGMVRKNVARVLQLVRSAIAEGKL